jgi:hypothetical protein
MSGLPSAIATLYTGNKTGKSHLFGTGSQNRYRRISYNTLQNVQMAGDVSSATLYMPKGGGCSLLLFSGGAWMDNYRGEYIELVNFSNSPWDVVLSNQPSLDGGTWNNLALSGLVVRTGEVIETRLSARGEWAAAMKGMIDQELSQLDLGPVTVARDGDPTFRWEPFPASMSHLNPDAIYIKIRQTVTIDIPVIPIYTAAISYWIHLFLDGKGALKGHVDRWRIWVASGLKTGKIKVLLADQAKKAIPTINTLLTGWCASQPSPLKDVYFLPGTKVQATLGGKKEAFRGYTDTDNDVTIVLAHPPQIPE